MPSPTTAPTRAATVTPAKDRPVTMPPSQKAPVAPLTEEEQGLSARVRKATVTLPNGQKITGTIKRLDDFNISLYDDAGDFHSWPREAGKIKVEVEDPLKAHRELLDRYTDEIMHNLTAYLMTLK